MLSDQEIDAANEYGKRVRQAGLYAIAARYDQETKTIHVTLKSGFTISFPKDRSQVTALASDADLSEIRISPAGWTVDFPKIDDGLTVEGMLAGKFGNRKWEEAWAAAHTEPQAA